MQMQLCQMFHLIGWQFIGMAFHVDSPQFRCILCNPQPLYRALYMEMMGMLLSNVSLFPILGDHVRHIFLNIGIIFV